jgi:hypothetical protein
VSHVTDNIDILEQTLNAYERGEAPPLTRELPPARRGGFRLLTALRNFIMPGRARRARQAQQDTVTVRNFELPIDILACKYPDLYLRVMTGVG